MFMALKCADNTDLEVEPMGQHKVFRLYVGLKWASLFYTFGIFWASPDYSTGYELS